MLGEPTFITDKEELEELCKMVDELYEEEHSIKNEYDHTFLDSMVDLAAKVRDPKKQWKISQSQAEKIRKMHEQYL